MTNYTPHKITLNFDIIKSASPSKPVPYSSPSKPVSPVSPTNLNVTMSPQSSPTFNMHSPTIYLEALPVPENNPYQTPPFHHSPYSWSPEFKPNWSP